LLVPRLALEATPEVTARYLGDAKGAVYLIRPDQHVAARWEHFDESAVAAAIARAIGKV
jgi:3-(3-hydroxy-phenyl)propionate hydroxylase